MTRTLLALGALVAVLALPFVARSFHPAEAVRGPAARERVVVVTPHNEAVRFELGRAFRAHMARQGRNVEIDWRSPGGTAEISRYLVSEYTASFQRLWTGPLGRRWSAKIAAGFMGPPPPPDATDEVAEARRAFLASDVGAGVDVFFGGGTVEYIRQAAAGRLVDAGLVARHPELFGPGGIPETLGGQLTWDRAGRWFGTCFSSFGICFNRDLLGRLGVPLPASWEALAEPRLLGQVALADPSKSGSVAKAFETIFQSEMQRAGVTEGWARAIRLIRRMGGNARYFTDAGAKIPVDVSNGDAAVGLCIDFFGRFQAEAVAAASGERPGRAGFVSPRGETLLEADPIGLLRGAPHRALAIELIEFVLSEEGQKIWGFRAGTPGGPERYALRRLPILPALYRPEFAALRADPDENPYAAEMAFPYREAWTGPLFGAMSFVVRAMCVDTEVELTEAYGALAAAGFPPRATATFDDVALVDYATVSGPIRAALKAPDPLDEAAWANRLVRHFRDLYRRTTALARAGQ
jgi:ABC-type Fe3+ transport system substrate-binding protein